MAVLPIVEIPDPRLRLVSKPVESIDDATRAFVADMIETMYAAKGIGLAAIQVGVDARILVIDLQAEEDDDGKPIPAPKAYINPEILSVSDEVSTYNEGCRRSRSNMPRSIAPRAAGCGGRTRPAPAMRRS